MKKLKKYRKCPALVLRFAHKPQELLMSVLKTAWVFSLPPSRDEVGNGPLNVLRFDTATPRENVIASRNQKRNCVACDLISYDSI